MGAAQTGGAGDLTLNAKGFFSVSFPACGGRETR